MNKHEATTNQENKECTKVKTFKSPIVWVIHQLLSWEDAPHQGVYAIDGDDDYDNRFEATAIVVNQGHSDEEILSIDGIDCISGDDLLKGSQWKDEMDFIRYTKDYYKEKGKEDSYREKFINQARIPVQITDDKAYDPKQVHMVTGQELLDYLMRNKGKKQ